MKLGVEQLRKVIAQIVSEEIKRQLPIVLKENLSELYLKKLIAESRGPIVERRQPSPPDDEEEEDPPVRVQSTRSVESIRRSLRESIGGDVDLFEGTRPIPSMDDVDAGPNIPEDQIEQSFDLSRARMLSGLTEKRQVERGPQPTSHEQKLRELEERRKALDVPVVVVK